MPGVLISGTKMNGESVNGISKPLSNGVPSETTTEQNGPKNASSATLQNGFRTPGDNKEPRMNGIRNGEEQNEVDGSAVLNGLSQLPPEIQHITQGYLPLAKLINRSVQECWNGLSDVVEKLSEISVSSDPQPANASYIRSLMNGLPAGDQSQENLEKKDQILTFAHDQRAMFIKLLVLSQWGKNASEISKLIDLNFWINQQKTYFTTAADFVGVMKRDLALAQIPNPDLKTAVEVLSTQRVAGFADLRYIPPKPLKSRQMLKTLRDINNLLCSRLTLHDDIPAPLRNYRVHDGRVTFLIPSEFELDLSIAEEDPNAQFFFVDFRFSFSPTSNIPMGQLHDDIARKTNDILKNEGLSACYDFLHDLVLSYKINILFKQALDLRHIQGNENLRVEMIHRTLVVQYWANRPAGKSWIEIGIKSGRRKKQTETFQPAEPHLVVRWLRQNKEVEDSEVEIDPVTLSLEAVLHQAIALHSSYILDSIYEKVVENSLYATGQLTLELSSSDAEPSQCNLQVQLTKSKQLTIALEPVSGSVIFKPTSPYYGRTEHDLSQSKNLIDEAPQRLLQLRCIIAELDLTGRAGSAGWNVLRTFRLPQAEVKNLFPRTALKHIFLRQDFWETGYMVAATQSANGGQWWLIKPSGLTEQAINAPLTSQPIESQPLHLEEDMSYSYFTNLNNYASGVITLQANAEYLNRISVRCVLPPMPRFEKGYKLPVISFQFQSIKLFQYLDQSLLVDWAPDQAILDSGPEREQKSWIRETITISFTGIDLESKQAIVMAKGRSTADRKALSYLANQALDPDISINAENGDFSLRFLSPIGKPIIDKLVGRLSQFDRIVSCVSIIQTHTSMQIRSVSLSHVSITYHQGDPKLNVLIKFPSSSTTTSTPLKLEFAPQDVNPHVRITTHLTHHLTNPEHSFTTNLRTFLPLLSFTYPLLHFLNKLQSPSTPTSIPTATDLVQLRLHILTRTPTMYGLQYFSPLSASSNANTEPMVARFEIIPHKRNEDLRWVLRPALEETESYSRSSFASPALKERLKRDVFAVMDANGWLALDSGAACLIDEPAELIQKVDRVVRDWFNEESEKERSKAKSVEDAVSEVKVEKQTNKPENGAGGGHSGGGSANNNSTHAGNHAKSKGHGTGRAGGQQQAKEIITLD